MLVSLVSNSIMINSDVRKITFIVVPLNIGHLIGSFVGSCTESDPRSATTPTLESGPGLPGDTM